MKQLAVGLIFICSSLVAAQETPARKYAFDLSMAYARNDVDIRAYYNSDLHRLELKGAPLKDVGLRDSLMDTLYKQRRALCDMEIWYLSVGYSPGWLSPDVMKSVSLGCTAARAQEREEIAKALNNPDGSGHLRAYTEGTKLIVVSEYFFDDPTVRASRIQALSQMIMHDYSQRLCDAGFTDVVFRGTRPIKSFPVRCK